MQRLIRILAPVLFLALFLGVGAAVYHFRESVRDGAQSVSQAVSDRLVPQEAESEAVTHAPTGTPAVAAVALPKGDARAYEVRVGDILVRSTNGVVRSGVDRLAAEIRRVMPRIRARYGDPFKIGVKVPPFLVKVDYLPDHIEDGGYYPHYSAWRIWTGRRGEMGEPKYVEYLCSCVQYFSPEPNWAAIIAYANLVDSSNGVATVKKAIELGRDCDPGMDKYDWLGAPNRLDVKPILDGELYHPIRQWRTFAALEELRARKPTIMRDYFALKLKKGENDELYRKMTVEQEEYLLSELAGKDAYEVFARYGWPTAKAR